MELKGIFTAFIGVHLSSGCLIEANLTVEKENVSIAHAGL